MGKGKPKTEITEYFMSQHFGICLAELDALLDVKVKEKSILDEPITAIGVTAINKPELFGGVLKEGGVAGNMQYLPGADNQLLPDLLAQKLGRPNGLSAPGYRGKSSLFFYGTGSRGFYWTANAPFIPGVWAKVRRILKRSNGAEQWYPEKAPIDTCAQGEEVRFRIDWLAPSSNPNFYIDVQPGLFPDDGLMDPFNSFGGNNIPVEDEATTTEIVYNTVRPLDRIELVWRGARLLPPCEINLRLQFTAGTVTNAMRARLSVKPPGAEDYTVLFPKARSEFFNGGEASKTLANDQGFFDVRSLWPDDWYFDYEGATGGDNLDMNPAHIIHECLTDREFGMGTPLAALDDAAFRAAADTLFDEKFGLSMLWTRQTDIQKFVSEVLDHIQGVIYTDPRTGLLVLSLIRDDYDPEILPVIDPDNADLSDFSRKLWGDIVNEIIVTWTNPANEQEETISAMDNASISVQGGVVSDSRNYYGVRCASLAQKLAFRDLRSAGQPLASCEAVVDRSLYDLRPASVVKLVWPEYGINQLVMRVIAVDYGRPGDPEIKLSLMEDVYGLDVGSFDSPPASSWVDPSQIPTDLNPVVIFTLPYFFAANSQTAAEADAFAFPEVLAGILATTANPDAWEYDIIDEVTLASGDTREETIGTNNIVGQALLSAILPREAESDLVDFGTINGNTEPTLAGFVLFGTGDEETSEIAMVIAENVDGTYKLARGVLDTVPREWPIGTQVFFVDESTIFEDRIARSSGELVDYKLLMRTSRGTLSIDDATLRSATLTDRPYLPNRPADVAIDGEAFSSVSSPLDRTDAYIELAITWANRNRITEDSQVLRWADATVTPESGQTTTIEVRSLAGTLLTAHTGLTGEAFDLPLASFDSEDLAEVRIFADRTDGDGTFASLQYWSEWVRIAGQPRRTEDNLERLTEADFTRLIED